MENFNKIWKIINQKYKKQLRLFYIIVAIFIISVVAWDIFSSKLIIKIAPISSKITINDQLVKNGQIKLLPGKYKIKAEKPEFIPKQIEVEVKIGQTKRIEFFLPQADGNIDWYLRNNEDDIIKTAIGSRNFTNKDEKLYKNNPILQIIPVGDPSINGSYRIDPGITIDKNGDEKVTSIIITINDCRVRNNYNPFKFQKNAALNWLKSKNVNLEAFEIKYIDNCTINRQS